MAHFIDKSAVMAEIEKLKGQLLRGACSSQISMQTRCKEEAYDEVLSFLDTLEVKEEPVSVWHNMDEVPIKGEVIVVQTKNTFYGLSVQKGGSTYKNRNKDRYVRWAYASDLLNLSNVQRTVKNEKEPVSKDLTEALRMEYEKGRADVLRCIDPDVMVADFCSQPLSKTRSLASIYRQGIIDIIKRINNNEKTSITGTRSIDDGGVHRA